MVMLGDICRDRITGFQGAAISRHEYLTGCVRYCLQPTSLDDDKLRPQETFDEGQLEVIGATSFVSVEAAKGGPQSEPQRPFAPTR